MTDMPEDQDGEETTIESIQVKQLEKAFEDVYDKFKLNFYQSVFKGFEGREATLSVTETFACESIYLLGAPTISELTAFMGVSQPNMTYKINSLQKKGYVKKVQSKHDKREFTLHVTDRFFRYNDVKVDYIRRVLERLSQRFPEKEIAKLTELLEVMSGELMPEVAQFKESEETVEA